MFEINKRDGLARLGKIKTKHGVLDTPTLLPVVNPKIMTLSMEELAECGAQGIITNSYIIYKNPKLKEVAEDKGVHGLVNWSGPIMTDSGTFQSHVYGEIEMKPEEILDFQKKIKVDIGTVLDVFCEPETRFEDAKKELEETQKRIEAADANKQDIFLAAPIQGGRHLDLRTKAAEMASTTNAEIFPIGGVVEEFGLKALVLPVASIALHPAALIARMTRSSMLEILSHDMIRTATSKGLFRGRIFFVHALRNAINPVVTVIGFQTGNLVGGAVAIEVIFTIRGMGELSQFSGEGLPHFYVGLFLDDINFTGIGGISILDDIKQIEIFKGPQSTSFGTNAMAGVINLSLIHI